MAPEGRFATLRQLLRESRTTWDIFHALRPRQRQFASARVSECRYLSRRRPIVTSSQNTPMKQIQGLFLAYSNFRIFGEQETTVSLSRSSSVVQDKTTRDTQPSRVDGATHQEGRKQANLQGKAAPFPRKNSCTRETLLAVYSYREETTMRVPASSRRLPVHRIVVGNLRQRAPTLTQTKRVKKK